MSYVQLILPLAVAEEFVDSIGREGLIEFTDLNAGLQPYQRQYTKDIMKTQEIERRIKEIEAQLVEYDINFNKDISAAELKDRQRKMTIDTITVVIVKEREIKRDMYITNDQLLYVNEHFKELKNQGNAEKNLKKQLSEREVEYFFFFFCNAPKRSCAIAWEIFSLFKVLDSVRVLQQIDQFLAWRNDAEVLLQQRQQRKNQASQRPTSETELLQPSSM
ncbi:hypothetical protein RFI_01243 [Reticulomyxa filosa]|uniref:V-type proton ATPase subunit a n=1 Tax=Reticulomyxa filosa TaxID=46433 RepID=X6PCC2_RETFI|nr:hypothetical protein RFI_01243 [Reticulomyxa filosa]|eukprot:ETO35821.1 hypothetical protein RFI_01243 [Reticulomyxa filosa]